MTRLTAQVETWSHADINVERAQLPQTGDDGQVIHDAKGDPKLVDVTILELVYRQPERDADGRVIVERKLRLQMDDEFRRGLIRELSGGIVVADGVR